MYIDNTILMYLFCIFGVFFYSPLVGKDKLECPLKQKWYVPSFADVTFVVLEKKCWKFAKFINGQTNGPRYLLLTCCCVEWYYSEQSHVMLHMSFCCCFTWLFFAVFFAVILLYSSYLLPLVDPYISRSHCLLWKATKWGDLWVRQEKPRPCVTTDVML